MAEAGKFLDPQEYRKAFNRLKLEHQKASPDRWEEQLLIDFPKIGLRSKWGNSSAGPGGAAFDLVFTTSDGRYDVKALLSSLMPDTVESPDLELVQIAKSISHHYNAPTNSQ